jgi:hypothetical protein
MKKLLAIALVATSISANAFWNNNSMPWDNNNGYNNSGYQENNGVFGYNQYDYWDPRWYMEEMSNMVDDFDNNNNGWNNHNNGYNGYSNNNSWSNGNNGNNFNGYNPYNNQNQNQWNKNQSFSNALPAPVIPTK